MAKKKKSQHLENAANGSPSTALPPRPSSSSTTTSQASSAKPKQEPSTSALIICRNKHWRYISSFHGPWLQLPHEVLESLAHSNYLSPRPHPIDPAVFYDIVKIRKAVDEAANLAVRAASGLTSAALSNSMNASNGLLGGAAALGLGYGGGGTNTKLSRERKHRMRELATQKLSHAYHLDEIAASVATMQSASTLEDVAQLVLQRNSHDFDAKYVHFFHEKIPSRQMAQCTPLDPLNELISWRPTDGSPFRTRALTRIFKEDYFGAARDLTEGLAVCRYMMAQHTEGKNQLVLARTLREEAERRGSRDWRQDVKVAEEDQPSSLESQLLFHRANVYFTIAVHHVWAALDGLKEYEEAKLYARQKSAGTGEDCEPPELGLEEKTGHRKRLEARKIVKANAKRAIRDYLAFLSHFDYTPGLPSEIAEEVLRRVNAVQTKYHPPQQRPSDIRNGSSANKQVSDALVPHRKLNGGNSDSPWPKLPPPQIYQVSALFSATPLASLPLYPPQSPAQPKNPTAAAAAAFAESHEAITYHPLLTDALHSLLLCHALVQTPPTELRRHAYNAARCARVCDGYPIFLAARSPARADWMEVLRRTGNWIGLSASWESLCRPAPLPGQHPQGQTPGGELSKPGSASPGHGHQKPETEAQKRERMKHEAILEALADERVVDEESFQRAVRARERRAREDEEAATAANGRGSGPTTNGSSGSPSPNSRRWAQEDGKEYPISTERAEAISAWVKEAPLVVAEGKGKKGKKNRKGRTHEALEESIEGLRVEELGSAHEEEVD